MSAFPISAIAEVLSRRERLHGVVTRRDERTLEVATSEGLRIAYADKEIPVGSQVTIDSGVAYPSSIARATYSL